MIEIAEDVKKEVVNEKDKQQELWDRVFLEIKDLLASGELGCIDKVKTLVKKLGSMHPSDAYIVIRDVVNPKNNNIFSKCKLVSIETYQEFQDLQMKCKKSYEHDRTTATNYDVDSAVSKAYGIILRMIRQTMDDNSNKFNKVAEAINKIEEHLGIGVTNFGEEVENDTAECNDEQGCKEITD